jgi:hypothetical protein
MSEETTTHVFTVVVQAGKKQNKVELFDFSGGEPVALASGEASNWRTALGEALSKISLSSEGTTGEEKGDEQPVHDTPKEV